MRTFRLLVELSQNAGITIEAETEEEARKQFEETIGFEDIYWYDFTQTLEIKSIEEYK
jgi:glutamine synthetase